MSSVLIKIKEMETQLTKAEVEIAKYILSNPNEIMRLNANDIANITGSSQATIVRFSKKLGYSGFSDFKIALTSDMGKVENSNINIIHEEIKINDSTALIGQKIIFKNKKTIDDTYKVIDFDELDKAVELLDESKRIFIIASGYSGITARDFQYKLLELGKAAIYESDTHIQFSNISTLTKGDLVFVISHSGKSSDVYSLLKAVKKREIKIITLTQFSPNPVKDLGDVKLSTVVEKNSFRSTALSSRIAQMTVIDIIYVKLIQKNKKLAEKYIGDAIEMVKEIKMK